MLDLTAPGRRRRPSLTPMIDVVFLLLVFFMLAARFGLPQTLPLTLGGAGAGYSGPPRLVTVSPDALALNGIVKEPAALATALAPLMSAPGDVIVLSPRDGADVQRLLDVMATLRAAGLTNIAVVAP
ncbi:biopolymer transporter ExbD [Mesobacterium sp. TK19101]|uniref:Biopolymer transporter ExbD n=1 Tax=Mesobacterium hydrothermale TaxID=3111907 RepID=A0ABU6HCI0_9RHOB|nr:biopolymer transporter ExbD [Mesobacterium sp. TK19101]MEC3859976.1 biopolymer transporter ExbD [Mesobacterium sp. TK19101]